MKMTAMKIKNCYADKAVKYKALAAAYRLMRSKHAVTYETAAIVYEGLAAGQEQSTTSRASPTRRRYSDDSASEKILRKAAKPSPDVNSHRLGLDNHSPISSQP